jgi:hypothetical protein
MQIMRTLIPRIHLLSVPRLTWGLTLSVVATLDNKVPLLMHLLLHLLQSSRDLAWPIKLQLISLVPHTLVWLVVPTCLFIILLRHHSLTPPYTPDRDHIGLHLMTTPRQMIKRSQGLKLIWTPIFLSFLMIIDKRGEELGLKLQQVSLKVQGVEKNLQNYLFSL